MTQTDWRQLLFDQDSERLWAELYRLILHHPLVRSSRFIYNDSSVISQAEMHYDLTQELFLRLFQKGRFQYYLDVGLTDDEIEHEISHIEISNLLATSIRHRYPESYRMARRISTLLQTSKRFRRFNTVANDANHESEPVASNGKSARYRRDQKMIHKVYGLAEWPPNKPMRDSGRFRQMIESVPFRNRDTRQVGCARNTQVIISNKELERLLVEIFQAIDSPTDVRTMRILALSKLPIQDIALTSVEADLVFNNGSSRRSQEIADVRQSPEEIVMLRELESYAEHQAKDLVNRLKKAVNNKPRRFARLLQIAWHCYFDPSRPSQLEIAEKLGVSDSSVGDYRRLFENEVCKLGLLAEQGQVFNEAMRKILMEAVGD